MPSCLVWEKVIAPQHVSCSVYAELSKEKKNVEFIHPEEKADLHTKALLELVLAFTAGCAALSSLLSLILVD